MHIVKLIVDNLNATAGGSVFPLGEVGRPLECKPVFKGTGAVDVMYDIKDHSMLGHVHRKLIKPGDVVRVNLTAKYGLFNGRNEVQDVSAVIVTVNGMKPSKKIQRAFARMRVGYQIVGEIAVGGFMKPSENIGLSIRRYPREDSIAVQPRFNPARAIFPGLVNFDYLKKDEFSDLSKAVLGEVGIGFMDVLKDVPVTESGAIKFVDGIIQIINLENADMKLTDLPETDVVESYPKVLADASLQERRDIKPGIPRRMPVRTAGEVESSPWTRSRVLEDDLYLKHFIPDAENLKGAILHRAEFQQKLLSRNTATPEEIKTMLDKSHELANEMIASKKGNEDA